MSQWKKGVVSMIGIQLFSSAELVVQFSEIHASSQDFQWTVCGTNEQLSEGDNEDSNTPPGLPPLPKRYHYTTSDTVCSNSKLPVPVALGRTFWIMVNQLESLIFFVSIMESGIYLPLSESSAHFVNIMWLVRSSMVQERQFSSQISRQLN